MALQSAIYQGQIRHRRYREKNHEFSYNIFMMYLDLDEIESVFSLSRFWSDKKWAPARFKRSDYIGDEKTTIYQSVQETIFQKTGKHYQGKVRLLSNLRYFGYIINPITNYYCFDESGETLLYIVAAVTNTPWGETEYYVLENTTEQATVFSSAFRKTHHVSPFMPMNMQYHWRCNTPAKQLSLHLQNIEDQQLAFDATLNLKRVEITGSSLNRILVQFPIMTVQVVAGIYWQALKLYLKGISLFRHPNSDKNSPPIGKENYDET